ncbi:unnamed protein product, partial [Meganyctiphanes norvegica]
RREDAGLYTCLASNREGDGHSNAVLLKVAHIPYCAWSERKHLVVAVNTSISLGCQVEAVPGDLVFSWTMVAPPGGSGSMGEGPTARGGIITGEGPKPMHPG